MKITSANITGSFILNEQDVTTAIQTSNVWSGSVSNDITSLNAATASINTSIASLNTATASLNTSVASLNNATASLNTAVSLINNTTASLLSFTASQQALNSTLATTGSNVFIGTQTVTGSLNVSSNITAVGTLTAQTLVVQTITSSVDFVTGSTRFGSVIGNTHQFTGSVSVSGSVTATSFAGSGASLTSIPNSSLNNSSITVTAGTGLSGGGAVSLGGSVTLSNAGVTSIVAGSGISINQGTGAVTVTNTITNTNQLTNGAGYITSAALTQLVSPNGASVVAADSAMPNAGQSFIHTLALGPGGNDGHILGMTWANTTSVYGAQLWLDTDPTNRIAIRSRNSSGTWNGWWEMLTEGNYGSYSTFSGAVTAMNGGTYSATLGSIQSSWAGSTIYPTLYGSHPDRWVMLINPHLSYVANGVNGFTGNSAGAKIRMASDTAATHYWDIGIGANGQGTDTFSVGRNGSTLLLLSNGGTLTATADVVAYSDARVKTNVKPIENSLNKVTKLTGVTYNRTDVEDKSTKIGFIAQEVKEVLPEVVIYDDKTDKYGVSYGNVTALLVEAIKEQQTQIEELKNLVKELLNR